MILRPARARTLIFMALGMVAFATGALVGCTPRSAPTPTPTAVFATEKEAFAAAEDAYMAYNEAVNARRQGDTAADPQKYLTGAALESGLGADRYLAERGLHVVGSGRVISFEGDSTGKRKDTASIDANACLDVSETRVLDDYGTEVTPSDRPIRLLLALTFVSSADTYLISNSSLIEGAEC